jgi:hypothetical protein
MKLRTITESEERTKGARIAHVGASLGTNPENQIWADSDELHVRLVWEWLDRFGFGDMMINTDDDFIDLHDGRDFLQENAEYDIVILHSVYNPVDYHRKSYEGQSSIFRVSPLHDRENWVNRLMNTGAKYIFTFGSGSEVDGEFLGEIPGYDGPTDVRDLGPKRAGDMQIYMSMDY